MEKDPVVHSYEKFFSWDEDWEVVSAQQLSLFGRSGHVAVQFRKRPKIRRCREEIIPLRKLEDA